MEKIDCSYTFTSDAEINKAINAFECVTNMLDEPVYASSLVIRTKSYNYAPFIKLMKLIKFDKLIITDIDEKHITRKFFDGIFSQVPKGIDVVLEYNGSNISPALKIVIEHYIGIPFEKFCKCENLNKPFISIIEFNSSMTNDNMSSLKIYGKLKDEDTLYHRRGIQKIYG